MYSTIYTGGLHGMESYLARVEVDISRGLPALRWSAFWEVRSRRPGNESVWRLKMRR